MAGPALPAGCGPVAGREQGGLPAGSPIRGLGSCILGKHWRVFAGVVISFPNLKHHQVVPMLLPPPSSSIPGGFGVTLLGAATGTRNHRCLLTHPPSPAGTSWVVWGCCHPPKGGPGVTVAVPAGVQSHPRQRERVRIRPVWLRRPANRLIPPSPLNRAVPRAAPLGAPWAGAVGAPRVPPLPAGLPLPSQRVRARRHRPGLPWEGARGRHAAPVGTSPVPAGPARLVLPPGTADPWGTSWWGSLWG